MKKFLLTTDLSEESKAAFNVTNELAKSLAAEIDLLAIIEDPAQTALMFATEFPVFPDKNVLEQLLFKAKGDLDHMAKESFCSLPVNTHVKVAKNSIASEILESAAELKVDMIILATHGRTGLAHLVMGSVAERVLRGAKCPVLLVPVKNDS